MYIFCVFFFFLSLQVLMPFFLFQIPFVKPPSHQATMPRIYKAKGILQTDRTALEEAFNYRVSTNCSIRAACAQFGVKVMTLQVSLCRNIVFFLL